MPCYGPCCTQYHSRMGTRFGPRHCVSTRPVQILASGMDGISLDQEHVSFWISCLVGLLHLGCRHCVLELVLAAAFGMHMGPSKAPGNPPAEAVAWIVGIN